MLKKSFLGRKNIRFSDWPSNILSAFLCGKNFEDSQMNNYGQNYKEGISNIVRVTIDHKNL